MKLNPGDMIRFGQSTRWFILNSDMPDEEEESTADDGKPRKKIQIVSKKQNEEFLLKQRVEQIKRIDE